MTNLKLLNSLIAKVITAELAAQKLELEASLKAGTAWGKQELEGIVFGDNDKLERLIDDLNEEFELELDVADYTDERDMQHEMIAELLA
ncbi:hypothetical protein P3547_19795 [Vibrio parahaemolyticus]|nr:hypothetical protein [Vibrio parahaemolyticus]